MDASEVKVLRGRVLSFIDEPQAIDDSKSYRYIEDGAVAYWQVTIKIGFTVDDVQG